MGKWNNVTRIWRKEGKDRKLSENEEVLSDRQRLQNLKY